LLRIAKSSELPLRAALVLATHCASLTHAAIIAESSEPPLRDEAFLQRSALREPTASPQRAPNQCMSCDATFRPSAPIQCTVSSRLVPSRPCPVPPRRSASTPPEGRSAPCSPSRRSSWRPGQTRPCRGSYTVRGIAVGSALSEDGAHENRGRRGGRLRCRLDARGVTERFVKRRYSPLMAFLLDNRARMIVMEGADHTEKYLPSRWTPTHLLGRTQGGGRLGHAFLVALRRQRRSHRSHLSVHSRTYILVDLVDQLLGVGHGELESARIEPLPHLLLDLLLHLLLASVHVCGVSGFK
jgi:hypothetical protein